MKEIEWNQVVECIGPKLHRYFLASFSPEAASDHVQETLIRLVKKYNEGAFDPKKGTLLMFAYGIAHYVQLEAWKNRPLEESHEDLESLLDQMSHSQHTDIHSDLRQLVSLRAAIAELNEIQKRVILLHIDEDLTLDEIGKILGIPLNTVKSHIYRAKDILKKQLNKDDGGSFE